MRELFAQPPRAEQALSEALEARRAFIWRQLWWTAGGVALMYGVPFAFDLLLANIGTIHRLTSLGVSIFAVVSLFRYTTIAPLIRAAREHLLRIQEQITVVDKTKNAAHNDELQFEYDVAHRRTTLSVLRRTRELAKNTLDALRARFGELEELASRSPRRPSRRMRWRFRRGGCGHRRVVRPHCRRSQAALPRVSDSPFAVAASVAR